MTKLRLNDAGEKRTECEPNYLPRVDIPPGATQGRGAKC